MLNRSFWKVCFLGCLVALFIAGCINYEEEIDLSKNGSGKMIMHYSLSQQLVSMMSMGQSGQSEGGDQEMPFKIKEEEIKSDLKANGVQVEKVERKTEGDQEHFFVHIAFDNLTNLNQTKTFQNMPFEFLKEGNNAVFKHTLKGKKKEEGKSGEGDEMGKQMAQAMFGNAMFKFKVKLPSKALPAPETNGKIMEDGTTVTWEWPVIEVGEGERVMVAKFKTGGEFPMIMILGIAGAAILSIIAFVIVMMIMRK